MADESPATKQDIQELVALVERFQTALVTEFRLATSVEPELERRRPTS